jgi:3-hydroxyisobutyrate dehydrogenase-like beta-hydroxyacid dehydrogenase
MEALSSMEAVVRQSDLFLCVVPPAAALSVAQAVAEALRAAPRPLLYVDCNAVSPQTARQIGDAIRGAGGRFVDGGIIGPPPGQRGATRFYISGPHCPEVEELNAFGLHFLPLGGEIGTASALKMCYAAVTKGTAAVWLQLLVAAQALGVLEALRKELALGQSGAWERMQSYLPTVPHRAGRWVGEMEEIAATFGAVGMTPELFQGAAQVYSLVAETPLARQLLETRERPLTLPEVVTAVQEALAARA